MRRLAETVLSVAWLLSPKKIHPNLPKRRENSLFPSILDPILIKFGAFSVGSCVRIRDLVCFRRLWKLGNQGEVSGFRRGERESGGVVFEGDAVFEATEGEFGGGVVVVCVVIHLVFLLDAQLILTRAGGSGFGTRRWRRWCRKRGMMACQICSASISRSLGSMRRDL